MFPFQHLLELESLFLNVIGKSFWVLQIEMSSILLSGHPTGEHHGMKSRSRFQGYRCGYSLIFCVTTGRRSRSSEETGIMSISSYAATKWPCEYDKVVNVVRVGAEFLFSLRITSNQQVNHKTAQQTWTLETFTHSHSKSENWMPDCLMFIKHTFQGPQPCSNAVCPKRCGYQMTGRILLLGAIPGHWDLWSLQNHVQ